MRGKSGAIEMSIGTIVIVVLSMSMLIMGIVLITSIFDGATNLVDVNNDQISSEIAKLYGDDKKLVIYPSVDIFEVKGGEPTAFAIRVKNLLKNTDASTVRFAYEISLDDFRECGLSEQEIFGWMKGESGNIGEIAPGEEVIEKVLFEIPEGSNLCSFKVRVSTSQNNQPYATDQMFVEIVG